MSKLLAYDFDIAYFKGKHNIVADALTRRSHLSSIVEITADWRHLILAEYAKDPWASGMIDGTVHDSRYSIVNELIIYKGRILLVPGSEMKNKVLRAFHDLPMAGHLGYFKTYK